MSTVAGSRNVPKTYTKIDPNASEMHQQKPGTHPARQDPRCSYGFFILICVFGVAVEEHVAGVEAIWNQLGAK